MKRIAFSFVLYFLSINAFAGDSQYVESPAFSYVSDLLEESQKQSLASDEYWKILLHYNGDKSVIRDDFFFLSENGNVDPEAELQKTITEFFRVDIKLDSNHPLCRYPARLKWISQKLKIQNDILPKAKCSALKTYLKNTSANKIYLSFASENVNNLMSMMGHIFLKISGDDEGRKVEHSLSYSAVYLPKEAISFVFKAIFLDAPGIYVLAPYNKKLVKYNDHQQRSIWEYELNFTQEQIDMLMLHVWEMKRVNARYSFISHNCGSALLYLLYVADPDFQKIYSPLDAPIDIVKNLSKNNNIKGIELFPADNYKFRMLSKNFSSLDRKIMNKFLESGDVKLFDVYGDPQDKANVLYGVQTVADYKVVNNDITQEKYDSFESKIDYLSASLPQNNLVYEVKNPLNKTSSSRVKLGYTDQGKDSNVVNFGFYPVYNSLNGDNSEYFNEFELQLANFEGGYYTDSQKLVFNNFDLIKIKSIVPYDRLINGLSGSFRVNLDRERFDSNSNRMFLNTDFGIGIAENVFSDNIIFYSMANFGYSHFRGNDIAYSNPEIGAIIREGSGGKLNVKYTKYFSTNKYKYKSLVSVEQTFFLQEDQDILFSIKRNDSEFEGRFNSVSLEYQYHF